MDFVALRLAVPMALKLERRTKMAPSFPASPGAGSINLGCVSQIKEQKRLRLFCSRLGQITFRQTLVGRRRKVLLNEERLVSLP